MPDPAESRPRPNAPVRALPHNRDLERSVLAMLLGGQFATAMHVVRPLVGHPLMYHDREHRFVYQAALELDDQGVRPDAPAVVDWLSKYRFQAMVDRMRDQEIALEREELDGLSKDRWRERFRRGAGEDAAGYDDSALAAIGGPAAIYELTSAFSSSAGLERNAGLLRDYHLKRRFIARMDRLVETATMTTEGFGKLVEQAGTAVLDLAKQESSLVVQGIDQVWRDTIDDIQSRINDKRPGIATGMEDIDRKLIALRPGGLYVFAARPGVGKTSLALKVAGNIAAHPAHPHGVLFFSLEVANRDLLKKLLCAESGIDFGRLDRCNIDTNEMELLAETADRLKRWPFDFIDVADLTTQKIRSVVKRRKLEQPNRTQIVFIDYLQLISGSRHDMSEYEKVSEITRGLKLMAKELDIPVVALSQMSRDSEKGSAPREPRLADLRGSGSIEQDADAVLFIHRDGGDDSARRIKLILDKNRFGPTGFTHMTFFPAKLRFEQAAPEPEDGDEGGMPVDAMQVAHPDGPAPAGPARGDLF